jgi:hypothetical protein
LTVMISINRSSRINGLLIAFLPLFFWGCGSGGGDSLAGGGIGGSGIAVSAVSVGSVSGFGSIIVNDVEYDTSSAEVVVKGEVQGKGDGVIARLLSRGMVVRVEGRLDDEKSGTAARVVFSDNLEGPVERILPLDDFVTELVIMGQAVRVDEFTVFQNVSRDTIEAGNVLEVSGLTDEEGTIYATYVGKASDRFDIGTPVDIKGIVQNLQPAVKQFTIHGLTIDYNGATVSGFAGPDPAQGQLAEIKGRLTDPDTLLATSVVHENELGRDDVDTVDIEGIMTQFTSISRFAVSTVVITTDGATAFDDVAAEDLVLGARLKVRGSLSKGVVLADEVASADKVKLESDASVVDASAGRLTLSGLASVVVQTDASTRFTGVDDLSQVNVGNHVKLFGRATGSGSVAVTKLLVKPGNGSVVLKGPVEGKNQPVLRVLSVEIDTSLIPANAILGKDGRPVPADDFFSNLQTGDTVAAKGVLEGSDVAWEQIASE